MVGFDKLGGFAVDATAGVNQVSGVELVTAVVTLVATGAVGSTDRTGAFNVTVGQGAAGGGRDSRAGGALNHVTVVAHGLEHFTHNPVVVTGGGAGK